MRKNDLKIQTKKSTKNNDKSITMLPVVITSYEIVMNDRKFLQKFKWKYIIVDEGHRLKVTISGVTIYIFILFFKIF